MVCLDVSAKNDDQMARSTRSAEGTYTREVEKRRFWRVASAGRRGMKHRRRSGRWEVRCGCWW